MSAAKLVVLKEL